MYAPAWVKTDRKRFPRAEIVNGEAKSNLPGPYPRPYTTLSYLGRETCIADSKAFAALMAFIHDIDKEEQTVVAVQVENETGLLGAARERSDWADTVFSSDVPDDFAAYMKSHTHEMPEDVRAAVEQGASSGSWEEVFGSAAEEIFGAYHISTYVENVAQAGKKQYVLPLMANCWLVRATGLEPACLTTYEPKGAVTSVKLCAAYGGDCLREFMSNAQHGSLRSHELKFVVQTGQV